MPGSCSVPRMVCVFPLLVCPYANTVLLNPPTTFWIRGWVVALYTCSRQHGTAGRGKQAELRGVTGPRAACVVAL